MSKTQHINILKQYLPEGTEEYVYNLIKKYPVNFKIVAPRKTKLGDFSVKGQQLKITVNNNLDPLNFLITTLHEIAHLYNWIQYKNTVAPHGKEWKKIYIKLFEPVLNQPNGLTLEEKTILKKHLTNPKASSCSDRELNAFLKPKGQLTLNDLTPGDYFMLENKIYTIEKKLRTRYLCQLAGTNRKYYISEMANIKRVKPDF